MGVQREVRNFCHRGECNCGGGADDAAGGGCMTYTCTTCGARMDAPGRYVIAARGYYWHLPCTTMQAGMVGFPSDGMLIPATILHRDNEEKEEVTPE